ncbi:hypothetical protein PBY51_003484 [Eleginops maclovinus]|uniref:Uncharacterized protein n=2 Tax=Eleginops maclovinus TaxID=56733 RepID=A0AAN7Y1D5_ELEMC|nr:hypothetical protein PBY51_003484 [Eleginops maclovinus]
MSVSQRLRGLLPSKMPEDLLETLYRLLDLLNDKEEALAHQRKVSLMLAHNAEELQRQLLLHSHCRQPEPAENQNQTQKTTGNQNQSQSQQTLEKHSQSQQTSKNQNHSQQTLEHSENQPQQISEPSENQNQPQPTSELSENQNQKTIGNQSQTQQISDPLENQNQSQQTSGLSESERKAEQQAELSHPLPQAEPAPGLSESRTESLELSEPPQSHIQPLSNAKSHEPEPKPSDLADTGSGSERT